VVSVVHDLSLARAFGTGAALLGGGKLIACGAVRDVFSDANLASVYGMDVRGWMRGLLERW
jgi:iron complex transport system ATP-binding protein